MAQKLYKAEVTSTFYFIAEEDQEEKIGSRLMQEALDDDRDKGLDISEVTRYEHLMDWDDHEMAVYGPKNDVTLIEAFNAHTGKDYNESREEFKSEMQKAFSKAQ